MDGWTMGMDLPAFESFWDTLWRAIQKVIQITRSDQVR
jgi:hypothetical protein